MLSWGRGLLGFGVDDCGGRLVGVFFRPCGKEDGEFTELGEELWPLGGLEVGIFGGRWWRSGVEEEGKWRFGFGFFGMWGTANVTRKTCWRFYPN